jgi:hypothetical protein
MLHVADAIDGEVQNGPRTLPLDVRHKTDPAGVFFVLDVVKTAFVWDVQVVKGVFHGGKPQWSSTDRHGDGDWLG